MSHFYGELKNKQHKDKTMRGFKTTGINAEISTWNEKISSRLYHDNGTDGGWVRIEGESNYLLINFEIINGRIIITNTTEE